MARRGSFVGVAVLALTLSACGLSVPADPSGTLQSVRGHELRVGISANGDYTIVDDGDEYSGSEVTTVREFADSLNADIEWTVGSEQALVKKLENDEVDLVIAGITEETPWSDQAGVTRPYTVDKAEDGSAEGHVMLVQLGENAFLTELETFLSKYTGAEG